MSSGSSRTSRRKLPHLFGAWDEVRARARRAGRAALLTDVDGTLTPIRRRPRDVRVPAPILRLLAGIAREGTVVGIVSGRPIDELRKLVGVRGIWYVGAHGLVVRTPRRRTIVLATRGERDRIARARPRLAAAIPRAAGIWIEDKLLTLAVHYRGAPPRSVRAASAGLRRAVDGARGLHVLKGKKVWEVLPGRRLDKAAAIRLILRRERRRAPAGRWFTLYLGDDATDERVFERFRGVSVLVGRRRKTAAGYYLRSPSEVTMLLTRWRELAP